MRPGRDAEREGATALLIVRNAFEHDSRVLRAARTLQALGFRTSVLAVLSWTERRQLTREDGIEVRRIGPSSRLAWALYGKVSTLAPRAAGRPGARRQPAPSRPGIGSRLLGPARGAARALVRWAATMAYYRQGIAHVLRTRPDLVHCNDYNTMWIGLAARAFCGSVVVYDSHELWPDRNLRPEPRWWLLLCERLFVRVAHRVITASPGYSEEMARRYRIPLPKAVLNVPDLEPAPAGSARPAAAGPNGRAVAVYVGGLLKNRGIEQSLAALEHVPDLGLRLIGPGPPSYRAELEELVEHSGLSDRVEFVPPVPSSQVVPTLSTATVGLCLIQPVCLSYRLTMPNKLFEYVLAGLPVLGSGFPMIGRFVERHGIGLTVDPEDVEAIARALREMLDPDRNAEYREAAARAAREIDWARERGHLEEAYREALAAAGRDSTRA